MKNKELIKIVVSIVLISISLVIKSETTKLTLLIISYIVIGLDVYKKSLKNIKKLEIFDENFLMVIATLGAFYIGSPIEAVIVMLLYEIGEYLAHKAVHESKESITKLMDLKTEKVRIIENDNKKLVNIEKVKLKDIFLVKPGEKIPLDGRIIEGTSYLDTSSLTGESHPKKVQKNDRVLSGSINVDSILKIRATATYENTTTSRIIKLIEESNTRKSEKEAFIRRFAKIYTPIIVISAILLVIIPTMLDQNFETWLYRALVFIVTSCPCALVISIPLGYFCGIGKASRIGALIKGSKELESLTNIDYLLVDKTGTITEGVFEVTNIKSNNLPEKEFIKLVASAEENSLHPIATAIKKETKEKLYKVTKYQEISGKGIACIINDQEILIGNKKLLEENKIEVTESDIVGTVTYVAINNKYEGYITISDKIKENSKNINNFLNVINKDIIMLSGDNNNAVEYVANELDITKYYGNLLPEDKVKYIKEYNNKGRTIFVGDGINDAPVIKIADVGVSMGNIGSDAAIEASDIVLMNDNIDTLRKAINIARITEIKVTQNIYLALIIKFLVLFLGVVGISTIWMAVVADVGVTLLSIINVLTIFKEKID